MKKVLFSFAIVAAGLLVASCGSKSGNGQQAAEQQAEVVVPDGYKTHDLAHFTISVPEEFTPGEEQNYDGNTTVRFTSEKMLTLDDGEYSSSATIDAHFMTGGATPSQIKEAATNLKLGQEATGETCDEPIIDSNTILMRHYYDADGYKVITWRWIVVSDKGDNIGGNICYPDTQAKYYDGVAQKIVKTIKFK